MLQVTSNWFQSTGQMYKRQNVVLDLSPKSAVLPVGLFMVFRMIQNRWHEAHEGVQGFLPI